MRLLLFLLLFMEALFVVSCIISTPKEKAIAKEQSFGKIELFDSTISIMGMKMNTGKITIKRPKYYIIIEYLNDNDSLNLIPEQYLRDTILPIRSIHKEDTIWMPAGKRFKRITK